MPKIKISQDHNLAKEELNKRVENYLQLLRDDKMKMVAFDYEWKNDDNVELKGNGFSGTVTLSGSNVEIFVNMSMMLAPFKSKVEDGLKKGLVTYLA